MVTVPLSPLVFALDNYASSAAPSMTARRLLLMLACTGHFSLFPLLFGEAEWCWKVCTWLAYGALLVCLIGYTESGTSILQPVEKLYLVAVLPALEITPQ